MKLTPLNITLACVLVWAISEMNLDTEMTFSWGWLIALCVILSLIDLGFRMIFKDLKKVWFAQIAFILVVGVLMVVIRDRKSTRLNSSHVKISYAVFCLKK